MHTDVPVVCLSKSIAYKSISIWNLTKYMHQALRASFCFSSKFVGRNNCSLIRQNISKFNNAASYESLKVWTRPFFLPQVSTARKIYFCSNLSRSIKEPSSEFSSQITKPVMAEKKYDLVVYGASGFTGQYTVDEVAVVAEQENLSWAIAGRNMAKLQKVLSEASSRTGKNLEEIAIIIADSSSTNSLEEMAKQARVVLNCVGPYRFYGEPVVRACIEHGTHHLDISGEPQFLEKMQMLYNGKAKENNTFVIGATGFDSVPAEAGVLYMEEKFKDGRLTNIENFFKTQAGPKGGAINTGTLESAVYALANLHEMKDIRALLYPEPMPKNEFKRPKHVLFHSEQVNKWCLPFVGSDESVIHRTIRDHIAVNKVDKPFQFVAYMCLPNLLAAIATMLFGVFFGIMGYFSPTRWLLLKYPHIFTLGIFRKGGPTKEQIDGCSFSMTFVGYGFDSADSVKRGAKPNRLVVAKMTGPEPGYVTTPICMVACGVAVLKEAKNMPHKGGVLTAGAAFSGTNLIERLEKRNVKIALLSDTVSN